MLVMIVEIPATYRVSLSIMMLLMAPAKVTLSPVPSTVKNLSAGIAFLTLLMALATLVKKNPRKAHDRHDPEHAQLQ